MGPRFRAWHKFSLNHLNKTQHYHSSNTIRDYQNTIRQRKHSRNKIHCSTRRAFNNSINRTLRFNLADTEWGQSTVKQATNRKHLNRTTSRRKCNLHSRKCNFPCANFDSNTAASISLKVSYSRGIEFHRAYSPSIPLGAERDSAPSNFPSGSPAGTDTGSCLQGQRVSLCIRFGCYKEREI